MPSLVTGIIGGVQSASAAHNAADAQVKAYQSAVPIVNDAVARANPTITDAANVNGANLVNNANDINSQMKTVSAGIRNDVSPYTTLGSTAAGTLGQLTQPGSNITALMGQLDPGYQFRLSEGLKAIQRGGAASGAGASGGVGKELARYGQGFASNEFGNTFNRLAYLAGQGEQASQFAGGADLNANQFGANTQQRAYGQAGQWNVGAADTTAQNTIDAGLFNANALIGQGQAKAQGDIGAANSWNGMLSGIGSTADSLLAGGFSGGGGFSFGNMLAGLKPPAPYGAPSAYGPSYNMQPAAPSWYQDLGHIG